MDLCGFIWGLFQYQCHLAFWLFLIRPGPWDFGAYNGRLYKQDDRIKKRIGGWCAKDKKKGQWLQVDLGKIKFVTAVATQGKIDRALDGFSCGSYYLYSLNWNLEMFCYDEGEAKPSEQSDNQQQSQPTYGTRGPFLDSLGNVSGP